jgi:pantothenate kinase type III
VVATGGLAEVVAPLTSEIGSVEPFLTLYGLQIAHSLLSAKKG